MNDWMRPNQPNLIGEGFFDLAQVIANQHGKYRYTLNELVRSLIVEIDVDGAGNSQGGVLIYMSDGTTGPYWRRVKAGTGRIFAVPSTKFVNFVPFDGNSVGFVRMQMVDVLLPPSSYDL